MIYQQESFGQSRSFPVIYLVNPAIFLYIDSHCHVKYHLLQPKNLSPIHPNNLIANIHQGSHFRCLSNIRICKCLFNLIIWQLISKPVTALYREPVKIKRKFFDNSLLKEYPAPITPKTANKVTFLTCHFTMAF